MFNSVNAIGAMKLFYVENLFTGTWGVGGLGGVCVSQSGIAIRWIDSSSPTTLSHEVIHNYTKIKDIYNEKEDEIVSGNSSIERMPDDWIGLFHPFYPKNTPHNVIVDCILMNGGTSPGQIIPFGRVYGVTYNELGTTNTTYKLELISVGQKDSGGLIPKSK